MNLLISEKFHTMPIQQYKTKAIPQSDRPVLDPTIVSNESISGLLEFAKIAYN
jgi:hypothetical protein